MSPVPSANRTPLVAIEDMSAACAGLLPFASVSPQSPNTANENGAVLPAAICDQNCGEASEPSRSVGPSHTR